MREIEFVLRQEIKTLQTMNDSKSIELNRLQASLLEIGTERDAYKAALKKILNMWKHTEDTAFFTTNTLNISNKVLSKYVEKAKGLIKENKHGNRSSK